MEGASISLQEFIRMSEERLGEPSSYSQYSAEATEENLWDSRATYGKPSAEKLALFTNASESFLTSSCNVRSTVVRDKHDINWCSPGDYLTNWNLLSVDDQTLLHKLISSDTVSNSNRYGLKAKNLETHLLLSIGCDMNNIINNGRCSVVSNLKSPSDAYTVYSVECVDNRAVDAKTCLRAYRKWNKSFSPQTLSEHGFVCYQAVITSGAAYRKLSNFNESKEDYHKFFKSNSEIFARWLKARKIYSYAYSHEVSVDSILQGDYRPHTHLIFYIPRENDTLYSLDEKALELEKEFNSIFEDRSYSLLRKEVDGAMVPRRATKYEEVEKVYSYLHNCYSLSNTYLREIRETNVRELNIKTVECYRNLVNLFKNEEGLDYRPVRRFNSSMMPKKDETQDYLHPLLQKKKKSNTIKKSRKASKEEMKPVSINKDLLKKALFGARARAEARDNAQFQQQMQDQYSKQHSDLVAGGMSSGDAIKQMRGTQQNAIDLDTARRNEFDQEMNDMQARRDAFGRASVQPGFRYSRQEPQKAQAPVLRGALSNSERENDRIVQNQIRTNNDPYLRAQQDATDRFPELGRAGSPMNKAFLDIVKSQGGAEALRNSPDRIYSLAQQANESLNTSPSATPTPAPAAPAQADTAPESAPQAVPDAPPLQVDTVSTPAPEPAPAQPAQASNDQSQNPLLNSPAASNPFSGNTTLSLASGAGQASPVQSTPAPAATPKPVAAAGPVKPSYNQDQMNAFRKAHGGAFDPKSKLDRSKMNSMFSQTPKVPTMTPEKTGSVNLSNPQQKTAFRKTASLLGMSELSVEQAMHELSKEKRADSSEGRFLNHIREELFKAAEILGEACTYSPEQITSITEDLESFQKAAALEATSFWKGFSEDVLSRGHDQNFLTGVLKQAQDAVDSAIVNASNNVTGAAKSGLEHAAEIAKNNGSLQEAVGEEPMGDLVGSSVSTAQKATESGMDSMKKTLGNAAKGGKSWFKDITSSLTPADDRNQIFPGLGNQYVGAAGGALLSAILGSQLGLEGPASWLVPLLGGAAGYHYLPKLINQWKDAPGTGTKAMSPGAAAANQSNPPLIAPENTATTQAGEKWKGTGFYGSPAFNRLYRNPVNKPTHTPSAPANIRDPFAANSAGFYP